MHRHLAGVGRCGLVKLHDLRPEHSCRTEFGDLHEIVAGDTHVELHTRCYLIDRESPVGEQSQPFGAPCKSIAKFLIYIGSGIAQHHAVGTEQTQSLDIGGH